MVLLKPAKTIGDEFEELAAVFDLILPLDFNVSHSDYMVTNGFTSLREQKINFNNFSLLKFSISDGAYSPLCTILNSKGVQRSPLSYQLCGFPAF